MPMTDPAIPLDVRLTNLLDELESFGRGLDELVGTLTFTDPDAPACSCPHRMAGDHGLDGCQVPFCYCPASTEPF